MTDQTEQKPVACDWCGKEPVVFREIVTVECCTTGCPVQPSLLRNYATAEEAIAAWNTRHEPHNIGWAVRQMQAGKRVRRKGDGDCYQYELKILQDGHRVLQVYEDGHRIAGTFGQVIFSGDLVATDWEIAE